MWKSIAKLEYKRFEFWENWKVYLGVITKFLAWFVLCLQFTCNTFRSGCSNSKLVYFEANISLSKPQYYIKFSVFLVLLSYIDKHPSKVQISAKYIRHLMLSGQDLYVINMHVRVLNITEHFQYPNLIIIMVDFITWASIMQYL
jgi:hypothetical protein